MNDRHTFTVGWGGVADRRRLPLLVSAVLLLGMLVVLPELAQVGEQAERARALSIEIEQHRRLLAQAAEVEQRVASFDAALAAQLERLPAMAASDGQAFSELQEAVGRLLAAIGTQLRNVTWGEAQRGDGVVRLPLRLIAAGEVAAVAALVVEVHASPSLRFDDLSLQRDPISERLVLIATLVGYRRGELS